MVKIKNQERLCLKSIDSEKDEKNKSLVNDMETLREKAKEYNLERVSLEKKEKANELQKGDNYDRKRIQGTLYRA